MSTWKFRTATPAQAAALRAFEELTFPCPVDIFKMAQFYHLLRSPTARVLIWCPPGSTEIHAACIGLLRHFAVPSGRIYQIAVHPSLQGKGMGGATLQAMEKIFRREGMVKACAEVRVSNSASRALFARHGYQETASLPAYYDDGEDGVKFWKSLF